MFDEQTRKENDIFDVKNENDIFDVTIAFDDEHYFQMKFF